jgi:adenylate cyclase
MLPTKTSMGSINEVNKNALLFSLATLLIGLVLVIFSSNKISKPIIALAAETKRMRRLNFSQSPPIESHIYEVQVMVEAVKVAKSALSSFAKYVPKMLVEQLMHNGNIAELGGEKKHITVLFSDICNFTHVTETTDANDLMLHLSDYLNELTMCIQHYKGSIDKYMGDAIMALWGVPQPDEDQVKHACLALLACRHKVEQHCQESELHGKPRFKTRFGLNTGFAIVGNVGSSDRLNYTAIGDAVNVASRLEKINKDYNTDIIVSEAVHAACSETFLFRPIDIVMIKGKNAPIQIYELVAENIDGHEFPATLDQLALCSHFAEAYTLYHANEFVQALDRFNQISHLFPEDSMTTLYIHRCHKALDAN